MRFLMTGLLAIVLLGTCPAIAQDGAEDGTVSISPLEREMAFMFREGGAWLAANPDADKGPEQSEAFLYRSEWGQGRGYGDVFISGLMPDGTERPYWRVTVTWDAEVEAVQLFQVSGFGAYATGTEVRVDDATTEVILKFVYPNGAVQEIRDTHTSVGADAMRSVTEKKTEMGWELVQQLEWVWTPDA